MSIGTRVSTVGMMRHPHPHHHLRHHLHHRHAQCCRCWHAAVNRVGYPSARTRGGVRDAGTRPCCHPEGDRHPQASPNQYPSQHQQHRNGNNGIRHRNGNGSGGNGVPKHLAVIMDGNHRWALACGLRGEEGHRAGVDAFRVLIQGAMDYGIQALTVYAFSLDNWKRDSGEREFLFRLFETCLAEELPALVQSCVHIHFIGKRDALPSNLQRAMRTAERESAAAAAPGGAKLHLVVAMNYNSRDDIARGMRRLACDVEGRKVSSDQVDANLVEEYLSTSVLPKAIRHPDMLLRTSGEQRLSNFLLWELAYAELCFVDINWPDFDREAFTHLVQVYASRNRTFGARA